MSNKSHVIILSKYQKIRFWPLFPALGPSRFFLGNQAVTYPDCIIAPYHPAKLQKKVMTRSPDLGCTDRRARTRLNS